MQDRLHRTAAFLRRDRDRRLAEQARLSQQQQEEADRLMQEDEDLLRLTRGNSDPALLTLARMGLVADPDEVDAEFGSLFDIALRNDTEFSREGPANAPGPNASEGREPLNHGHAQVARGPAVPRNPEGAQGARNAGLTEEANGESVLRGLRQIGEMLGEVLSFPRNVITNVLAPDRAVTEIPDPNRPRERTFRVDHDDGSVTITDKDARSGTVVRETRYPNTILEQYEDGSVSSEHVDLNGNKTGTNVRSPHPPKSPEVQFSKSRETDGKKQEAAGRQNEDGKKRGKVAADSTKNERHADGGRARAKTEKQIEDLREKPKNTVRRREKKILDQKTKDLRKVAKKSERGTEHSIRRKR